MANDRKDFHEDHRIGHQKEDKSQQEALRSVTPFLAAWTITRLIKMGNSEELLPRQRNPGAVRWFYSPPSSCSSSSSGSILWPVLQGLAHGTKDCACILRLSNHRLS